MSMRDVIPLRRLIDELATQLDLKQECLMKITTIWEDNDACHLLASSSDLP